MTALTLDHLVITVHNLDIASVSYRRLFGRTPSWRGAHPTYGTSNALFRLDGCYVELLAPDPTTEGDSPWLRALRDQLDTAGEGLYALALGTDDIDSAVAEARDRGLDVLDPASGDGVDRESGLRREWRNARIELPSTRGLRLFFIQHGSPAGALPVSQPETDDGGFVSGVDHIVVASSHLADSLRLWHEKLGLDVRLTLERPNGRRLCFLRLGDSLLELAGEAEPERPGDRDLFWGVAYRVPDVEQTVARLRAAGVEVSDARHGNAEHTMVADLKPGFSHDVRTLLIQTIADER